MYTGYTMSPELTEAFERAKIIEDSAEAVRRSERGRQGNRKGHEAETRALNAAHSLCLVRSWLRSARKATPDEDGRGIDIVVETTIGPLYLQIKSSLGAARSFRHGRKNCKAIVVIITPDMDDEKVKNKVFCALCRLRRHFMKIRRG